MQGKYNTCGGGKVRKSYPFNSNFISISTSAIGVVDELHGPPKTFR